MLRQFAAAFAVIAITAAAAPAFAVEEAPKITLKLSDLDLSTAQGVQTAKQRIAEAARKSCTVVDTGSRVKTLDTACQTDVAKRLTDRFEAQQQAAKAAPSQNAGIAGLPKAVDQPAAH